MSDNDKHKTIFHVWLDENNKIIFQLNSKHVPTLDYIVNELMYNIIEIRAMEKMQTEIKNAKLVQLPDSKGLMNYLRGRRGKNG